MLQNAPPCLSRPHGMGGDECSDFKDPIGRTFLSGNCIFAETGLRRELSRTKVSAIWIPASAGMTKKRELGPKST
jgi:hypothetical protein